MILIVVFEKNFWGCSSNDVVANLAEKNRIGYL